MTGAHAQPIGATADLPRAWTAAQVDAASSPVPRAERVPSNTHAVPAFGEAKSYSIPAAEVFGFAFLLNQVNRHTDGTDFDSNTSTIRRNLHSSWVVDRDPFAVNQLGHPYQGSMYHAFARSAGLDYWESLGYAFAGSALWEIAGESTLPSRNDQINTGIGGSFLGEILFRLANLTLEHDDLPPLWRETAAGFISPSTAFNRLAFGDRFKGLFPSRNPVYFSRLQIGFSGSAQNQAGTSTTKLRRNEALVDYSIDYGLPGKRGYTYDRPFDYFHFQFTAATSNALENVMSRGLLVGTDYVIGDSYRGIWGLYGTYDYIAPQIFRVSTTSASLGTTGQWWISREVALQGTVLGGVGYGSAGEARSGAERDYRAGLSAQGLLALRLIFGDAVSLDMTARQYHVTDTASDDDDGQENILRADVSLTWRLYRLHGLTLKYVFSKRDASYDGLPDANQQVGALSVGYTYLGQTRSGAVDWRPRSEGGPGAVR